MSAARRQCVVLMPRSVAGGQHGDLVLHAAYWAALRDFLRSR